MEGEAAVAPGLHHGEHDLATVRLHFTDGGEERRHLLGRQIHEQPFDDEYRAAVAVVRARGQCIAERGARAVPSDEMQVLALYSPALYGLRCPVIDFNEAHGGKLRREARR